MLMNESNYSFTEDIAVLALLSLANTPAQGATTADHQRQWASTEQNANSKKKVRNLEFSDTV